MQSSREVSFPYSRAGRPSASADIFPLDARVHKKDTSYQKVSFYKFYLYNTQKLCSTALPFQKCIDKPI